MKKLLYYLLSAAGVVFLFAAFDGSPKQAAPPTPIIQSHTQHSAGACALQGGATTKSSEECSFATKSTPIVRVTSAGPSACAECHEDEVNAFYRTTHSKSWQNGMACEQCHGDVSKHIASGGAQGTITNPANLTPQKLSETCLKCHEQKSEQSHWKVSEHARAGVACVTCHDVHPSKEQKTDMNAKGKSAMIRGTQTELCLKCHTQTEADFNKPTHHRVMEGTMQCTDCHNPHGSDKQHQLRADTKTLCVKCHQDKRGPFMYEHNAMSTDGCLACHEQHGSSARNMLKVHDVRELCESCHSAEMGVGPPHGRGNLSTTSGGDCTRCHVAVHGSNRDKYFIE